MYRRDPYFKHIQGLMAEVAHRAQIRVPVLQVERFIDTAMGVFALGRNHSCVLVSDLVLRILNDDELQAALAHEMGHIHHNDGFKTIVWESFIHTFSVMWQWAFVILLGGMIIDSSFVAWENGVFIGLLFLLPIYLNSILMEYFSCIKQVMEFKADAYAKEIMGGGELLVSGLIKLELFNKFLVASGRAIEIKRPYRYNTHPPIEDRIRRLLL